MKVTTDSLSRDNSIYYYRHYSIFYLLLFSTQRRKTFLKKILDFFFIFEGFIFITDISQILKESPCLLSFLIGSFILSHYIHHKL